MSKRTEVLEIIQQTAEDLLAGDEITHDEADLALWGGVNDSLREAGVCHMVSTSVVVEAAYMLYVALRSVKP